MMGYWILFWVLFPVILFVVPLWKILMIKIYRIDLTPEQNKKNNVGVVIHILFYWLCNVFYMSWFANYLICHFICGALIILIIFMSLSNSILYPKYKNVFEKWGILLDFCIGIILTIRLIYVIPDSNLQAVVIPIIAAIYGGMLTLVGVLLTIKKSDADKKKEELKKAKPLIFIADYRREQSSNVLNAKFDEFIYNDKVFDGNKKYAVGNFLIRNVDYSYSSLQGICFNNDIIWFRIAQAYDKNRAYYLTLNEKMEIPYSKEIKKVYLLLVDLHNNYFTYEVNCEFDKSKTYVDALIRIVSGIELKRVTIDKDNLIFKEVPENDQY